VASPPTAVCVGNNSAAVVLAHESRSVHYSCSLQMRRVCGQTDTSLPTAGSTDVRSATATAYGSRPAATLTTEARFLNGNDRVDCPSGINTIRIGVRSMSEHGAPLRPP